MSYRNLKPGDRFSRMIGDNKKWMEMEVLSVDDNLIHARAVGGPSGYTFCRNTGAEEDHDLGWGVKFGVTGSYISKDQSDGASKERNPS